MDTEALIEIDAKLAEIEEKLIGKPYAVFQDPERSILERLRRIQGAVSPSFFRRIVASMQAKRI